MPLNYEEYVKFAKFLESKRLGYPLGGGSRSQFFQGSSTPQSLGVLELFPDLLSTMLINIGDPESTATEEGRLPGQFFPEDVEYDVIRMLAAHFGSSLNDVKGYVTTGGTEANLAAVWWLRNALLSDGDAPIHIFISDQAHYCSRKIADMLKLKIVTINSNKHGSIDLKALKEALAKHIRFSPESPAIVWATVGTTILGGSDDILAIQTLLKAYPILKGKLHVDGAILGITIPVLKPAWSRLFDIADSLAISGHKLLGTIPVCGAVICRKELLAKAFSGRDVKVGYVHGVRDVTITGGRWSVPIFALHFTLKALKIGESHDPLQSVVKLALANADYLAGKLRAIAGEESVQFNPQQFNVIFPLPKNPQHAESLKEQYTLMSVGSSRACVSVFPQVSRALLDEFVEEYFKVFSIESIRPKL